VPALIPTRPCAGTLQALVTSMEHPRRSLRAASMALAAVAVVAFAWFVLCAHQAHDVDAATALLQNQSGYTAAGSARTRSLLDSADFLTPGTDVTLLRARLAMEQHRWTTARRLVDQATRSEPDNLQAWISALDLAVAHPPAIDVGHVVARLRALDPVDARNYHG
jgi:hypothetical protein